jgi:AcrR family transcriptional regulator
MAPSSPKSKEAVVQEFRTHSIQEAAMRVIARKGMAAATMQEIAAEAGIAKGTIYLYFRDRDELVEKTFDTAMNELMKRVDSALDPNGSFEENLRRTLSAKMDYFLENREFFRLYLSLRFPEGSPAQQRRQKRTCQPQYRSRVTKMAEAMEQAMERGEIRRMDPFRLALFIIEGSMALTIERVMEESPPPTSVDVDLIVRTIMGGLRPRSTP